MGMPRFDFRKALAQPPPFGLWMLVPNEVIRRANQSMFAQQKPGELRPVVVVRNLQNGRVEVRARSASVESRIPHKKHDHRPEDDLGDSDCVTTKDGFIAEMYLEVDLSTITIEHERCSEPNRTDAYRYLRSVTEVF